MNYYFNPSPLRVLPLKKGEIIFKKIMNIFQKTIINFVKTYQKYLSPDHSFWAKNNPPYCMHIPSCSEYMIEAVEKK